MQLFNVQNVCKMLNKSAPYALLFEPSHDNTEERVKKFIDKFAEQHQLETSPITPRVWSFSHKSYGHLNDGVIEVDFESTPPMFSFTDVSEAKITNNSPDIDNAVSIAKDMIEHVKLEYIDSLKELLNHFNLSTKNLSKVHDHFDKENSEETVSSNDHMEYDLDTELKNLQTKYHVAMDKLQEVQNYTGHNYDTLKAQVDISLASLENSIKDAQAKVSNH